MSVFENYADTKKSFKLVEHRYVKLEEVELNDVIDYGTEFGYCVEDGIIKNLRTHRKVSKLPSYVYIVGKKV